MARIKKAVIPAAGFGTRFLPVTKATPKEMLPIVDKPTIQYIVEEALASGIEEILIISGHAKRAIEDHFDSAPVLERELEDKGQEARQILDLLRDKAQLADMRRKMAGALRSLDQVTALDRYAGEQEAAC